MLKNLNGSQLGDVLRVSVGNFGMDPSSVMSEEIWWETVRLMCLSHHMEDWLKSLKVWSLVHPMGLGWGDV